MLKQFLLIIILSSLNIFSAYFEASSLTNITTSLAVLNLKNLKQTMPHSSVWQSIIENGGKSLSRNILLNNFIKDCNSNIKENQHIPKHQPNKTDYVLQHTMCICG